MRHDKYHTRILQRLQEKAIAPDTDQLICIEAVDKLFCKKPFFSNMQNSITGIYIWGPPGRGKSLVADICMEVYSGSKIRIHFHEFLQYIIQLLSSNKTKSKDNIGDVLDRWLSKYELICFDEFHVHNVGDTMLVLRFIERVVEKKHKIILTSNYEPDLLQPDPIFHHHFLPAIDLIKSRFKVIPFTHHHDYRMNENSDRYEHLYHSPLTDASHKAAMDAVMVVDRSFTKMDDVEVLSNRPFKIWGKGDNSIAFTYTDLCLGVSSYVDYLEMVKKYGVVVLSGITQQGLSHRQGMQRFIWLLDVLYDNKIKFITTSEAPLIEMVKIAPDVSDINRTISRLHDMGKF